MLLSHRRLTFTDSQMVFQCRQQDFRESIGSPSAHYIHSCQTEMATPVPDIAGHGCTRALFQSSRPDSIFPDAGIGNVADEIYTRIEEYSTRTLSYPQDVLNAFNGVFSEFESGAVRQDGHDHFYGNHFWGVPIFRYDGDNPEYKAVCSLVAGLTWRTGSPNFYDRDSVSRPGKWPSWSWTAIMGGSVLFGATNLKDVTLHDSGTIWATLRHQDGRIVDIKDFMEGRQDSMDYQLSIDLSTWVLPDGNLIQDESGAVLFTHHSFDRHKRPLKIDAFLDMRGEDLGLAVIAAYLGHFEKGSMPKQCFLLGKRTASGKIRRIGLGIIAFVKHRPFVRSEKLTNLPGGVASNPFGEWKLETITLV